MWADGGVPAPDTLDMKPDDARRVELRCFRHDPKGCLEAPENKLNQSRLPASSCNEMFPQFPHMLTP